jgi:hypothetical protein
MMSFQFFIRKISFFFSASFSIIFDKWIELWVCEFCLSSVLEEWFFWNSELNCLKITGCLDEFCWKFAILNWFWLGLGGDFGGNWGFYEQMVRCCFKLYLELKSVGVGFVVDTFFSCGLCCGFLIWNPIRNLI